MLGLIARVLFGFRIAEFKFFFCKEQAKIGGWLRGVFLSFMGSIKVVVVVQSTWLSPVLSYNSFNQVPPCTRMNSEFAWQLLHKIQSKSSQNPGFPLE